MSIYKYSQKELGYVALLVFFMQFFYIQNHSYYLASKMPLVIFRKFLYFLISI